MSKVLFISTSSSPGMAYFAKAIIESVDGSLDYRAIFVSTPANQLDYRDLFPRQYDSRHTYYSVSKNWVFRAAEKYWPVSFTRKVMKKIRQHQIDLVYFLTTDTMAFMVVDRLRSGEIPAIYTVHDVVDHQRDSKGWLEDYNHYKVILKRKWRMIHAIYNLTTCGTHQATRLAQMFPDKRIHQHPFPSLVLPSIAQGRDTPPELQGTDDYLLFFGRIEAYKGIDVLLEAFALLRGKIPHKLVIAGAGPLPSFPPTPGIICINRHIAESEIAELFKRCRLAVYPYLAGSMSGVPSFPLYFGRKIVASDIPLFSEVITSSTLGELAVPGNAPELVNAIMKAIATPGDPQNIGSHYERQYSVSALRESVRTSITFAQRRHGDTKKSK